jgi:hypothetical protein
MNQNPWQKPKKVDNCNYERISTDKSDDRGEITPRSD